jgi:hypothetical protein
LEAPGFNFSRLTWNKVIDFAEDLDVDMDYVKDGQAGTISKTGGNQAARGAQTLKRRRIPGPADNDNEEVTLAWGAGAISLNWMAWG